MMFPNNVLNWLKNKAYQLLGLFFIIFSLYLYFVLYCFDFHDYGNPYTSAPQENIASFFIITSISLTVMSKAKFSSSSVLEKIEEEKTDPSEPEIPKLD